MRSVFTRLMGRFVDGDRYPTLAGVLASEVFNQPYDVYQGDFEFGLQRILDGVEALVEARSS